MAFPSTGGPRVTVDGKFFRLGGEKFFVKGLSYGPFAPNSAGLPLASEQQTSADFAHLRRLGANVARVYDAPPRAILDLAGGHGLKLFIDIPWNKHLCVLGNPRQERLAREAIQRTVAATARHPAVFAYSVANEIPPDVLRWSGVRAISAFIDGLIGKAKEVDPECLCAYSNFPPTEYLRPGNADFLCFNIYLHQRAAFRNYLKRLQMQADAKPLVLGETGIDSLREGEEQKCQWLGWQIEEAFRGGLAGAIVFSFTDDWWRDGKPVEDWQMGITTRERQAKPSAEVVKRQFAAAPYFPLRRSPRISVVVASYNGARTLTACLESLLRQNYPDYEVILVDDGSTDHSSEIAAQFPRVRYLKQARNLGLSAARNAGIAAASGEIIAFTDSDCRADSDWLHYTAAALMEGGFVGVGGPNLLPPEDSAVAAAVMASPGGPAHVMLTDEQAEHIPGCNMSFFKWALVEIGGFDPVFRKAGDDVDLCWRVQQAGFQIGFSPVAFVWHYRRSTVRDYLRQQHGYGEAEALLVRKHPEYFNAFGGGVWRGRIYAPGGVGGVIRPPIIYRGFFGSAGHQFIYAMAPAGGLMLCTTLEFHLFLTLPLWILSAVFRPLLPLATASLLTSLGVCAAAAAQARLPRNKTHWWSRPLVAGMFLIQPLVRGWARYQGRLRLRPPAAARPSLESIAMRNSEKSLSEVCYWTPRRIDRYSYVLEILRRLDAQGWAHKVDPGWRDFDFEIFGSRWSHLQVTTVLEDHPNQAQMLRCRLRPRWSLPARAAFGILAGINLLILGFTGAALPWVGLLLLSLPLFVWILRRDQRNLQSMIMVFLDGIAKEWNMVVIRTGQPPSTDSSARSRRETAPA